MPILALSPIHPSILRPSIQLGLTILPVLIGVAMCIPAYLVVEPILAMIGIDTKLPIKGQDRAGLAIFLMTTIVIIAFVGGYILGFFVNAAVCRLFLSWPREKVVAVFFRSEIPPSWLKQSQ